MKCAGPDGCPRDDCDGVMRHLPTPNWPDRRVCDTCRSIEIRPPGVAADRGADVRGWKA